MGNYSFKTKDLPKPDEKGVIEGHNFTQGAPHTKIYEGVKGLTFRKCNLTNCDVPSGSEIDDCLVGHISFFSHVLPKWLDNGFISECSENCSHVTHTDNITIDGVVINTNYSYENLVVE